MEPYNKDFEQYRIVCTHTHELCEIIKYSLKFVVNAQNMFFVLENFVIFFFIC